MSRGEELIQAYTNALEMKVYVATKGGVKHQSLQDDIDNKVTDTKKALLDYTVGMEDVLESVAKSIDVAIAGLETYNPIIVEEDEEMSCGDFTPRDFNMIEERNTIIDDINREGFHE